MYESRERVREKRYYDEPVFADTVNIDKSNNTNSASKIKIRFRNFPLPVL